LYAAYDTRTMTAEPGSPKALQMLCEAPPATAEMHGLRFLCPDMARPSAAAEQGSPNGLQTLYAAYATRAPTAKAGMRGLHVLCPEIAEPSDAADRVAGEQEEEVVAPVLEELAPVLPKPPKETGCCVIS